MQSSLTSYSVFVGPAAGIDAALFSLLSADGSVAGYVAARIYPLAAPQSATMPAIVYERMSADRIRAPLAPLGEVSARYEITAWDDDYAGVLNVAEAVRLCLDGYEGDVGSVHIKGIELQDETLAIEQAGGSDQQRRYAVQIDFLVVYEETVP